MPPCQQPSRWPWIVYPCPASRCLFHHPKDDRMKGLLLLQSAFQRGLGRRGSDDRPINQGGVRRICTLFFPLWRREPDRAREEMLAAAVDKQEQDVNSAPKMVSASERFFLPPKIEKLLPVSSRCFVSDRTGLSRQENRCLLCGFYA